MNKTIKTLIINVKLQLYAHDITHVSCLRITIVILDNQIATQHPAAIPP